MREIFPGDVGSVTARPGGNYDNVGCKFTNQIGIGRYPCSDFDPSFDDRRV
tara:strand:+ start:1358 stop:1510 length:153 start_codon:yes stop_codon:yes gene_type:complete